MKEQEALKLLQYHPAATKEQEDRCAAIRAAALGTAMAICKFAPESAEQTLALRALHLAVMHAVSAIVIPRETKSVYGMTMGEYSGASGA